LVVDRGTDVGEGGAEGTDHLFQAFPAGCESSRKVMADPA
jgi:hypothetical protein